MVSVKSETLRQQAMSLITKAQMMLCDEDFDEDMLASARASLSFAFAMLSLQGAAMRKEQDHADE